MDLTCDAFASGRPMPRRFSREGDDLSPPFEWQDVPEAAESLAVLCEDPDAPGERPFVHWLVYNIPADRSALPEGGPVPGSEATNDFGERGYGGPMPPPDHGAHRYHFRLYAVDRRLDLEPGASREELLRAMEGHVLAQSEWVGLYERGG